MSRLHASTLNMLVDSQVSKDGGASGKHKAESSTPSSSDTADTLVRQLMQIVNNLKADFGSLRKIHLRAYGAKVGESGKPKKQYCAKEPVQNKISLLVLGRVWAQSYKISLQKASVGSKLETINIYFKRTTSFSEA
jgi:hypothetical protein